MGDPACSTHNCVLADLNDDQYPHLLIANRQSSSYAIFNDSRGQLPTDKQKRPATESATTIVAADFNIVAADFNGDKLLDIVVGYAEGGSRLFLNKGQGTTYTESEFGKGKGAVDEMSCGDANADGPMDIVQARKDANMILFI